MEKDVTILDINTREQLMNSSWNEFIKQHPLNGTNESLQIAKQIYEFAYTSAWKDMSELSTGLFQMDEMISNLK